LVSAWRTWTITAKKMASSYRSLEDAAAVLLARVSRDDLLPAGWHSWKKLTNARCEAFEEALVLAVSSLGSAPSLPFSDVLPTRLAPGRSLPPKAPAARTDFGSCSS
jgi:hypothetical protein